MRLNTRKTSKTVFMARLLRHWRLAAVPVCCLLAAAQLMPSLVAQPDRDWGADRPLIVDENSRVAVMEYEAWFGPNGVTFQNSASIPVLQSADMQAVGGGYDSADPAIIKQHVAWFEEMGIDAAISDLTNGVSCTFNSEWFIEKYLQNNCNVLAFQTIRDNTGNLYPAWTRLGTRLKLIPLLGGDQEDELYLDRDGKTSFEKEIEYFGKLMDKYPGRTVIYEGKPLMLIFTGAAQDPDISDNPLWYQFRTFIKDHPAISEKYTFKEVAGYLDSQSYLWVDQNTPTGPVEIAPEYHFWSWVDRLNPTCTASLCPYYPSYNRAGQRVENFTASIATAGQNGWGCPNENALPYCEDDALRYGKDKRYATFEAFMRYGRELDPIFLIVHQFNEFQYPDEGFDANTNDDVEPSDLWDDRGMHVVKDEVWLYHHRIKNPAGFEIPDSNW
jgi:hypothetical protein